MPKRAWQRYSHVEAGAAGSGINTTKQGDRDDVYQDITITHAEKESPTAEITFWGLRQDSWEGVAEGDPLRVVLGHTGANGIQLSVFDGIITNKAPRRREGSDFKYTLKGADKTRKRLANQRGTDSWEDPNPGDVARNIASLAGVSVGEVRNPPGTIGQTWSINEDQPYAHHLKRLTKEAEEIDGEAWKWYAKAGKLYFVPKEAPQEQAIILKSTPQGGGNLIRIEEASGTDEKTDGGPALDFEAIIDPRIEFDGLAQVQGASSHNGTYWVAEYTLTSTTKPGSSVHKMEGKLEPTSTQYRLENGRPPVDITGSAGGRLTQG